MRPDPLAETYYNISPYAYCGNNIDPTGEDYWSTNDPEQIRVFINAIRGGDTQFDFSSGWNHMTDAEFADKLSYNEETGKFYISYATVENGEIVVNGRSFDANLTPVSFSGDGYPGAFVYQPRSGFWGKAQDKAGKFLYPTEYDTYDDGTNVWKVNSSGRITGKGIRYVTGMPPAVGRGGKISTKGMPHGDGGRSLVSAEKRIAELQKQMKTATKAEQKVINKKIQNIKEDAQRKAKGETHGRKGF
jgi:hypothetical protein